jgi:hypothetical protein
MLLHGPFVGGAYKYIDPTPSKNVSDANSMLPPAASDATRAHAHRCGAWDARWAWDERGPCALVLAHATPHGLPRPSVIP